MDSENHNSDIVQKQVSQVKTQVNQDQKQLLANTLKPIVKANASKVPELLNIRQQTTYQTASLKLTSTLKKLQLKHLNDLLPIKKPSAFILKSSQLFCLMLSSIRKDFEVPETINTNIDWIDIVKFLTVSPRMYQEIQTLKIKIDNIEYNYHYVQLLKDAYLKNEKFFSSNKQTLSESCGILLQLFLSSLEYINIVEELRCQSKWDEFKQTLKKEIKQTVPNVALTHRQGNNHQIFKNTSRSRSPLLQQRKMPQKNSYINKSSNDIHQDQYKSVIQKSGRSSILSQTRSTSQLQQKKDVNRSNSNISDKSLSRRSLPPKERTSPTKRLINIHRQKITQAYNDNKLQPRKNSISKHRLNHKDNGFNIVDTLNKILPAKSEIVEQQIQQQAIERHISQLNIDFSFCSESNIGQGNNGNKSYHGEQLEVQSASPQHFATGLCNTQVNIFASINNNVEDTDDELETRPLFKLDLQDHEDEVEVLRLKSQALQGQSSLRYRETKTEEYENLLNEIHANQRQSREFIEMEETSKSYIGDKKPSKMQMIENELIRKIEQELYKSRHAPQQSGDKL